MVWGDGEMKEKGSEGGGGWRWEPPGMRGVSAVRSERQSWRHSWRREEGGDEVHSGLKVEQTTDPMIVFL